MCPPPPPQDTAGGREKEAGRYPSTRKALGDRAAPRAPKEKQLKPEKAKKDNAKARGVSQPTPKPKPPAHQQTVVRGITYYKAGQAGAAEGPAGGRGEFPAWGRGRGGWEGWGLPPQTHRPAGSSSPQRAL